MPLQLDDRQRAMLLEMGVRVWLPGTAFALAPDATDDTRAAEMPVRRSSSGQTQRPPTHPVSPPQQTVGNTATVAPPPEITRVTLPVGNVPLPETPDWAALASAVATCNACGLCAGRTHGTLGATNPAQADWMVVGDPPDEDEDAQGMAFAGASGELLDNMLRALQLQRTNAKSPAEPSATAVPKTRAAYVTSVVKCRPPHGVVPQAADLAQCAAWLQREIALVQPRMILAMGRFANQVLLSETPELITQPLDRLRGRLHQFAGVPVVLTYHPKALMRTPPNKAKAWADLCLAADTLEAETP